VSFLLVDGVLTAIPESLSDYICLLPVVLRRLRQSCCLDINLTSSTHRRLVITEIGVLIQLVVGRSRSEGSAGSCRADDAGSITRRNSVTFGITSSAELELTCVAEELLQGLMLLRRLDRAALHGFLHECLATISEHEDAAELDLSKGLGKSGGLPHLDLIVEDASPRCARQPNKFFTPASVTDELYMDNERPDVASGCAGACASTGLDELRCNTANTAQGTTTWSSQHPITTVCASARGSLPAKERSILSETDKAGNCLQRPSPTAPRSHLASALTGEATASKGRSIPSLRQAPSSRLPLPAQGLLIRTDYM